MWRRPSRSRSEGLVGTLSHVLKTYLSNFHIVSTVGISGFSSLFLLNLFKCDAAGSNTLSVGCVALYNAVAISLSSWPR